MQFMHLFGCGAVPACYAKVTIITIIIKMIYNDVARQQRSLNLCINVVALLREINAPRCMQHSLNFDAANRA